ncbi:MAG TPA: tyrosine-type recombinase/integrase [Candidatus Limnocylindrales bacterium]|nr:tyrosine-type recombinase/integrase [Candidatus Limnocylindrales bacterium]
MNPQLLPAQLDPDIPAWTQTVQAFLAEKHRRSGSERTVQGYGRMLWPFLTSVGSPDRVTPAHVLAWAHGIGASGRRPSSATVGARIACLSSYFRFLIRMGIANANPCDALERPRSVPSAARGLSADQVRRLLTVVPDTIAGRRDRALLLTFILTGRRRSEVIGLAAGDINIEGETVFYSYRGKGGKRGRRELPRPACEALSATLADLGLELASMDPSASLWQAAAGPRGVTGATFYARFRRYLRAAGLAPSGLHILRHTAAKLRRDAGSSIEAVSSFLDHSSLAVTSVYLRRLEGEVDRTWPDVALAIGL